MNQFITNNESLKSSSNKNDDSGKKSRNFSAENIAPKCKNKNLNYLILFLFR